MASGNFLNYRRFPTFPALFGVVILDDLNLGPNFSRRQRARCAGGIIIKLANRTHKCCTCHSSNSDITTNGGYTLLVSSLFERVIYDFVVISGIGRCRRYPTGKDGGTHRAVAAVLICRTFSANCRVEGGRLRLFRLRLACGVIAPIDIITDWAEGYGATGVCSSVTTNSP